MSVLIAFVALLQGVHASWYWPFGSSERDLPRLSEIMEPASTNIDAAADFVAEGNLTEAIVRYERALLELDRIEAEHQDRMQSPGFSTIKTKRAYVRAALDSLKLKQVKDNARSVSVSDTTGLERKLAEERAAAGKGAATQSAAEKVEDPVPVREARKERPVTPSRSGQAAKRPGTLNQRIAAAISKGDYGFASKEISGILGKRPNDATALNLRAAMESRQGKYKEAEKTLDQAILSHPRSYHAYYNMSRLKLSINPPDKDGARRYYETGRVCGGPENPAIETALKEGGE